MRGFGQAHRENVAGLSRAERRRRSRHAAQTSASSDLFDRARRRGVDALAFLQGASGFVWSLMSPCLSVRFPSRVRPGCFLWHSAIFVVFEQKTFQSAFRLGRKRFGSLYGGTLVLYLDSAARRLRGPVLTFGVDIRCRFQPSTGTGRANQRTARDADEQGMEGLLC